MTLSYDVQPITLKSNPFGGGNGGGNEWRDLQEDFMALITDLELKALKKEDNGRSISFGKSMTGVVRVALDGTVSVHVTWRFKVGGKTREKRIGTWKPKGGMSLRAIYAERERLGVLLRESGDPVAKREAELAEKERLAALERQRQEAEHAAALLEIEADRQEAILRQQQRLQELAAQQARVTVKGLFEQWQRLDLARRADKGSEVERAFKRDIFPLIGDMAVADVTKAHIQQIVDDIKARATPAQSMIRTAKKTLAELRQMFGFALDRDYIAADPSARISKAKIGRDVERDRVLSEAELIDLFQKLPKAGVAETSQLALLLQLATVARIGEVLGARWEHVDMDRRQWTLPETKNGKRHVIWLSDVALQRLEQLRAITGLTPWLFPAKRAKKDRPDFADHVCEKTVTKQVGDRQRPGSEHLSGRSKQVDALVLPGGRWTPHDLRRTGATMMAELGALPDVVEKCLNHTEERKVKRIYQRAQYEGPMREAWRLLGERLSLLEARASGDAANVVTLRAA